MNLEEGLSAHPLHQAPFSHLVEVMDTLPGLKFQLPISVTDLFEALTPVTFSLTSNAKTVLTKIVSNPIKMNS